MLKLSGGVVVCVTFVLCLLGSHASLAETIVEGSFGLHPEPDGTTAFAVRGWAIGHCDEPQQAPVEVVLLIDESEVRRARPFLAWPGVEERYPDVPGAEMAGFSGEVDPSRFSPGEHRLEVVVDACGLRKSLGTRSFQVISPTSSWIAAPIFLFLFAGIALIGVGLARLRHEDRRIGGLPVVIAVACVFVAAVVVGARQLVDAVMVIDGGFFAPLGNWDGNFYLRLAADGYGSQVNPSFAFFPLFPAVLAVLSLLPGPLALFGSLFNIGIFVGAVVLLRRLYPEQDASIVFFAALPFAFFHLVVYTEALALLLAVAFVSALKDRRLALVACFGFLAALCRIPAIALVCFSVGPLLRKDWRAASVAAAAPVCGLATWMLWLGATARDPFAFLNAMGEFGRATSFHPGGFLDLLSSLPERGGMVWWEVGSLVVVLVGSVALARLGRFDEALYSAVVVLIPVYSMRLTSLNRYALAAFPVFILLGGRLAGSMPRTAFRLVIAAELVGLLYFAARFGLQYWVG